MAKQPVRSIETTDQMIPYLKSALGLAFVDSRKKVARHKTKVWARRDLSLIQGVVMHQSAGSSSGEAHLHISNYHVGPNHISSTGCPGPCYNFILTPEKVHLVNDLEDVTWSQGGRINPIPKTHANRNFAAVCLAGDFSGPSYSGKRTAPPKAQQDNAAKLWEALADLLGLGQTDLFGHYHFGKENCPGTTMASYIDKTRALCLVLPKTTSSWQRMLVDLGYDLGKYGRDRDGVDGSWGAMSRTALKQFQTVARVQVTGFRDTMTAVELAYASSRRTTTQG